MALDSDRLATALQAALDTHTSNLATLPEDEAEWEEYTKDSYAQYLKDVSAAHIAELKDHASLDIKSVFSSAVPVASDGGAAINTVYNTKSGTLSTQDGGIIK